MKIFTQKNWTFLLGMATCAFLMLNGPLTAGITHKAKTDFDSYFEKAPWIGLVMDEIDYGPLQISHVHIHDGNKLAVVAPGEILNGSLKYRINVEDLDSWHMHHLLIGISGEGAQDCVMHNLGIWDSKGKGHFKLKAPEKPGVYQVRFLLVEELTCSAARDVWNFGKEAPSSSATIGIIIVE